MPYKMMASLSFTRPPGIQSRKQPSAMGWQPCEKLYGAISILKQALPDPMFA